MLKQVERDCKNFEEACKARAMAMVDEHKQTVEDVQRDLDWERENWVLRELHWISVLKQRANEDGQNTGKLTGIANATKGGDQAEDAGKADGDAKIKGKKKGETKD